MSCEVCIANQQRGDRCHVCGGPFDWWAIHYTTVQCQCGEVYQEEVRECERCHNSRAERMRAPEMMGSPLTVIRAQVKDGA